MLAMGANARGRAGFLAAAGLRPQDVFATSLYTGTGAAQAITTGFQPDLIWFKKRSAAQFHALFDAQRGITKQLDSSSTASESDFGGSGPARFSTGFSFPSGSDLSGSGSSTHVAWSFRRAAKFFDIVIYTGDGTSSRQIAHGLGVKPGVIHVKNRTGPAADWIGYHVSIGATKVLSLNRTDASSFYADGFRNTEPTETSFTIGGGVNNSGVTYVAYLFAHDPDTTNGVVQCGSLTANADQSVNVNLGWKPQFLILKRTDAAEDWIIIDTIRGWSSSGNTLFLCPSSSRAEGVGSFGAPTPTGFSGANFAVAGSNYIYCAIRAPT